MRIIVNIDVPDLQKAIDFYTQALGLTLSRTIEHDVAELVGGSSVIYLLQKDVATPVSKSSAVTRHYARHWTPVHMDFVVDDLESAKARALKAGAVCENECVEWMGSKCITFSDPFGHGFCLIAFSHETYVSTT